MSASAAVRPQAWPDALDEVRLRRVHVTGVNPSAAQALVASQALTPSTLAAAWSQEAWPSVGTDQVLLLRRLAVRAPARSLARETAAAARELAAQAVDPWSPGAAQAPALRFASRADHVAWHVQQLLQRGVTPAADSLARLLSEAAPALTLVWRRLRQVGGRALLDQLWRALDAAAAAQLLATVAAATDWLSALRSPVAADAFDRADARWAMADGWPSAQALRDQFGDPARPAADPRTRLAALLAAWVHAPSSLQAADAPQALQAMALRLSAATAPPKIESLPQGLHPQSWPGAQQAPEPHAAASQPTAPGSRQPAAAGGGQADRSTDRAAEGSDAAAAGYPGHASNGSEHDAAARRQSPHRGGRVADPTVAAAADLSVDREVPLPDLADRYITRHGGLFWLFQVLALPPFQQRLLQRREPQAGWREWVRLVQALQAEPDATWWALAAQRCGLADEGAAAVQQLCWPTDVAQPLLAAARQRFGDEAMQSALAERPVCVVADEVRVDVHFRMADARIEVRRVGLDIDPGWLPWLGCVLRWHFGSPLAPQPGQLP